jgi:hypothetical protein
MPAKKTAARPLMEASFILVGLESVCAENDGIDEARNAHTKTSFAWSTCTTNVCICLKPTVPLAVICC